MRSRFGLALFATALTVPVAASSVHASSPPPPAPSAAEEQKPVDATGVAGTPAASVAEALATTLSQPVRFGLFVDITGTSVELDGDRPIASGAIDGTAVSLTSDVSSVFGLLGIDVPAELGSIDVVLAGTSVYVRSPLLGAFAAAAPAPMNELAAIGDGWGEIDLASQGGPAAGSEIDVAGALAMIAGSQQLIAQALTEVEITDLGESSIDGTAVHGYEVLIPADDIGETAGAADLVDTPDNVPAELWIDADGHVRRLAMVFDASTLDSMGGTVGDALEMTGAEATTLGMQVRLDFSDFGSTDIAVQVPTDAVDITSLLQNM